MKVLIVEDGFKSSRAAYIEALMNEAGILCEIIKSSDDRIKTGVFEITKNEIQNPTCDSDDIYDKPKQKHDTKSYGMSLQKKVRY